MGHRNDKVFYNFEKYGYWVDHLKNISKWLLDPELDIMKLQDLFMRYESEVTSARLISLQLFCKYEPDLWFHSDESIFEISRIYSDNVFFGKVLSMLYYNSVSSS